MPDPPNASLPPQNLTGEEHVLGACMLSRDALDACAEILVPADFYRTSHGTIFAAMLTLTADGVAVDAITVTDRLRADGTLAEVGGADRIRELATLVPAARNAPHHARIVRRQSVLRRLIVVGETVAQLGWEQADEDEAVAEAERLVFEIAQGRSRSDFVPASVAAREAFTRLEELYAAGTEVVGLRTGFTEIDKMTSGLHPGTMVVIGGRPSMGKSSYALGIVAHAAIRERVPVAFFTLEVGRFEVMQRLFAMEGNLSLEKVTTPSRLGREDWSTLARTVATVEAAPIYIEDGALSIPEIRSKVRRLKSRVPDLGLVVVDYLQLAISGTKIDGRQNEVAQISRSLKQLAAETNLPVIVLSQLSREVERRHDSRPTLADLRDSGAIEADADVALLLYREEYYFPEDDAFHGLAEVNVAKQRNGPTGVRKLAFVKRCAKFGDLAREPEPLVDESFVEG